MAKEKKEILLLYCLGQLFNIVKMWSKISNMWTDSSLLLLFI